MPSTRYRIIRGAACATIAAGCASSSGTPTTEVGMTPMTQQVTLPTQQNIRISSTPTSVVVSEVIAVGADSTYGLLLRAYSELQIPAVSHDARSRTVGNPLLKIRRRLGGVSLVKYLDCGNKEGLPNAETYDLVLNIASAVGVAREGHSTVSTRVDGVASHPVFGASNQMVCSSTGELEKRIAGLVKQMAGIK